MRADQGSTSSELPTGHKQFFFDVTSLTSQVLDWSNSVPEILRRPRQRFSLVTRVHAGQHRRQDGLRGAGGDGDLAARVITPAQR